MAVNCTYLKAMAVKTRRTKQEIHMGKEHWIICRHRQVYMSYMSHTSSLIQSASGAEVAAECTQRQVIETPAHWMAQVVKNLWADHLLHRQFLNFGSLKEPKLNRIDSRSYWRGNVHLSI